MELLRSAIVVVLDQALVDGGVLVCPRARHRRLVQVLSDLAEDVAQCGQLVMDRRLVDA